MLNGYDDSDGDDDDNGDVNGSTANGWAGIEKKRRKTNIFNDSVKVMIKKKERKNVILYNST